jgi:hypothetical protein
MPMGHVSQWKLLDFITLSHWLSDRSRRSRLFSNEQPTLLARIFQNDYAGMKSYGISELSPSEGRACAIGGVQLSSVVKQWGGSQTMSPVLALTRLEQEDSAVVFSDLVVN